MAAASRISTPAPMRARLPAQALIEKVLDEQDAMPRMGALRRLLGADPLDPQLRSWYRGALGEILVAKLLSRLPRGWAVFHSIPVGAGQSDIDHLVVGPAGVFTINTKHHPGATVWIAGGTTMIAGQRTLYIRNAESEARRIDTLLARHGLAVPSVRPVLAFVALRSLTVRERPRAVLPVRAEHLVRTFVHAPTVLESTTVEAIAALLDRPSLWRSVADPDGLAERFATLRRRIVRAERRRRLWSACGGLLVLLAALAGLVVVLGSLGSRR